MPKFSKILIPTLFLLIASCGDDAEEIFNNATDFPEAQGESQSSCVGAGAAELAGVSKKDVLILMANQTEFQTRYYSSSNCASDDEIGRVTYKGEFAVERTSSEEEANSGEITFEMEKALVEVFSENLISVFNTVNFCGRSDYTENETREVTKGSDGVFCPVSDVPATLYGNYRYNSDGNTILLSADPVDMSLDESLPSLPLVDVFASEFVKQ